MIVKLQLLYGLLFWCLYFLTALSLRKNRSSSPLREGLFMLGAFYVAKGTAAVAGAIRYTQEARWLQPYVESFSQMFEVVANVFLFQAALSLLLFRHTTREKFRVVSIAIFLGYLLLYFLGAIPPERLAEIGRQSFGYNGAMLAAVALVNIFYVFRQRPMGLLGGGLGFFLYAFFEGLIKGPFLGVDVLYWRVGVALLLAISGLSSVSLIRAEPKVFAKVSYV
mgnify:CR=1 FL=1|jgi:hypothetical protein